MPFGLHGRSTIDGSDPRAQGRCDRCGFWYNLRDLKWQMQWSGTQVINTGLLVCPDRCLDDLQPQQKAIILPPDPLPVLNARPEPFGYDETDWLTTEDGFIITTQSGTSIITQEPNPESPAAQANLYASFSVESTVDVDTLYLDLFYGPAAAGNSILEAITGSATRIPISSSILMTANGGANSYLITVVASALAQSNVTSAGLFDAATGGSLLATSATGSSEPLIVVSAAVQFQPGSLVLDITYPEMVTEDGAVMLSESGAIMVVQ